MTTLVKPRSVEGARAAHAAKESATTFPFLPLDIRTCVGWSPGYRDVDRWSFRLLDVYRVDDKDLGTVLAIRNGAGPLTGRGIERL